MRCHTRGGAALDYRSAVPQEYRAHASADQAGSERSPMEIIAMSSLVGLTSTASSCTSWNEAYPPI